MRIIRESTHISGFLYERPVPEVPALTHCGEALCARGHQVKPHVHSGFEFHYLSHGGPFGWRIGRQAFEQRAGEIFINHPRERHHTGPSMSPESHFLWIGLELSGLGAAGRRLAALLAACDGRVLRTCQETEPVLRGLIAQIISPRARQRAVVEAYLQMFIVLLEQRLRATDEAEQRVDFRPYSHGTIKAISYLEKNLDRRVSLEELTTAVARRGVTNFCTQFRREVGVSPAAYHRRLRLQAAREALRQPSYAITTAALEFGFNSMQHFCTHFRREFGVSPGRYQMSSKTAA